MVTFIRKVMNYTWAYAKWVAAGKPLRDDEYIFELFSICEQCPAKMFIRKSETEGECADCGCVLLKVSSEENDQNKLAWPTEGCQLGFWDADVEEPNETSGQ